MVMSLQRGGESSGVKKRSLGPFAEGDASGELVEWATGLPG